MLELTHLTNKQLKLINSCNTIVDLIQLIGEEKAYILLSAAGKKYFVSDKFPVISHALFNAITDAPSYLILILWTIVGLISLPILPLAILSGGTFLLTLLLGGFYFYSNYKELKKQIEKNTQQLQFTALKLQCINELIDRYQNVVEEKLTPEQFQQFVQSIPEPVAKKENHNKSSVKKLSKIKQSIGVAFLMGTLLFGTYYLGANAVIAAFGAAGIAAAMTTPVGIAAAVLGAIIIGSIFAYKAYQQMSQSQQMQKNLKKLENELERKQTFYTKLTQTFYKFTHTKRRVNTASKHKLHEQFNRSNHRFSLHPLHFFNRARNNDQIVNTMNASKFKKL